MPLCTLHVGTMKTGTSTIQEVLFFKPNPPGFQYAGLGRPNGSFGIQVLFDDPSFRSLLAHNMGNDWSGINRVRDVTWQRLERAVRRAKQRGEHLILSAEIQYGFNDDSLERLRQFLQASGLEVQILGYLRPYRPYLESLFQKLVQMGKKSLSFDYELERSMLGFQPNVERFWRVFGRDRTTWVKFDPATSRQRDRGPCISSEAEMQIYAPEALAWVARETDDSSPPREAGEATVDWVVERMEMLRQRLPSMREIYTFLQQRSGEWYNRVRYAK